MCVMSVQLIFFFFQAEDGIRDYKVTGVQTCALPIYVLMAWENEALLAVRALGADKLEIVVPSVSILAEPPVAVVDKVALRRGTREVAMAYLGYLYSQEGQEIIARHGYRPRDPEVAARHAARFPPLKLATIADFGGWAQVQRDRKSTRLNSSHLVISYAVFCLKKKKVNNEQHQRLT